FSCQAWAFITPHRSYDGFSNSRIVATMDLIVIRWLI
ncbi:hypothetical protein A2U01_0085764, partial [Trifolium medium]|nr:hypothetical protein [Trifolium medium]